MKHYEITIKIGKGTIKERFLFTKGKLDAVNLAQEFVKTLYGDVEFEIIRMRNIAENELDFGY